jgi:hypothetical protein
MHHEIVAAGTQRANQAPLGAGLALEALALPVAIDQVQLRKRGMPVQHRRRIGIHQRVDLAPGAWCLSVEITGAASSTSPWWRSLITSARRRPAVEKTGLDIRAFCQTGKDRHSGNTCNLLSCCLT